MTTLYQDEIESLGIDLNSWDNHKQRNDFVHRYAWAIPNEEALQIMAKYAPIVEIGAGTGYWAAELQARGVEIAPFDAHPPIKGMDHKNGYWKQAGEDYSLRELWTTVWQASYEVLSLYPDSSLFLCWPPMDDMAVDSLKAYSGNVLIYVGEDYGGCTANDAFFDLLEKEWDIVEECYIPTWSGIHDLLTVYRRK